MTGEKETSTTETGTEIASTGGAVAPHPEPHLRMPVVQVCPSPSYYISVYSHWTQISDTPASETPGPSVGTPNDREQSGAPEDGEEMDGVRNDDAAAMMAMMGVSGFGSTKV
jgi:hypothetical protein